MTKPNRPRRLPTAGSALLLVAGLCAGPGLAQVLPGGPENDELTRLRERVGAALQQDARDADLIEPLTALGILYHEDGRNALAIATLASAIDLVRVNYGLSALEQAPLMQHLVEIHESLGSTATAWALEQELLDLAKRNPDDIRAAAILQRIGDDRIELLERYLGGDLPPEVFHGCYYEPPEAVIKDCTSGSKRTAAGYMLREAWDHYEAAIDVLIRQTIDTRDEIDALELQMLRTNVYYGSKLRPPSRYEFGRHRLEEIHRRSVARSAPLAEQVAALVDIADWELLYSRNQIALDIYLEAQQLLATAEHGSALLDSMFAPSVPVVVPDYLPNPLDSRESETTAGHIDFEFEMTRFGRSRRIDVVATAGNVSEAEIQRLQRLISHSRFRPRLHNGGFAGTQTVRFRYFVHTP